MFKVVESKMLVPNVHMMEVEAPEVAAHVQPGQFVMVRAEEDGERIPLSVSDWDVKKGTVTMVFVIVGGTTSKLSTVKKGESIPTVAGPLGNPVEMDHFGNVLLLGGCYGIGSIYPMARALKEKGNGVLIAVESKSSFLYYWEEKLKKVCDNIVFITRDGTKGYRGHVNLLTDLLKSFDPPVNRIIANGCNLLLKSGADASRPLGIKTIVCLNTLMIDGTGMCGVCRVTVGGGMKFACVDGPYFDGHEVDWDELFQRRQSYLREEVISIRSSRGEKYVDHSCC